MHEKEMHSVIPVPFVFVLLDRALTTTTVAIATRVHVTGARSVQRGEGGGASCRFARGGWADHGHGVVRW